MNDDQFKQLMKKLEDIEREMKAGTWWPRHPGYLGQPMYPAPQPYRDPNFPPNWGIPQATD